MNNLKLKVLFTVLIAWSTVLLFTMSNVSDEKKVSDKSIISVDNVINRVYDEYTDDLQLIKASKLAIYQQELKEKRQAELIAKREANNKEKMEQQKNQTQVASISRGQASNQNWIVFEATHYSAFCNTGCTGITALSWDVRNTIYHNGFRVIAVDPNVIPLGSLVEVKAPYGSFKALAGDTGGAIDGKLIDILVKNDNVANRLGRIKVQIRIIK